MRPFVCAPLSLSLSHLRVLSHLFHSALWYLLVFMLCLPTSLPCLGFLFPKLSSVCLSLSLGVVVIHSRCNLYRPVSMQHLCLVPISGEPDVFSPSLLICHCLPTCSCPPLPLSLSLSICSTSLSDPTALLSCLHTHMHEVRE